MKKVNKDLVAFNRLAKENGMTYGQLQQRETLMKLWYRTPKDENAKYRRVGNGKSDFHAE